MKVLIGVGCLQPAHSSAGGSPPLWSRDNPAVMGIAYGQVPACPFIGGQEPAVRGRMLREPPTGWLRLSAVVAENEIHSTKTAPSINSPVKL